jgi:hypothetical protein
MAFQSAMTWGRAFAPPWTLTPLPATRVVARESRTSGQPAAPAVNRLAAMVSEISSLTTQVSGGIRAASACTSGACCPDNSHAWKLATMMNAAAAQVSSPRGGCRLCCAVAFGSLAASAPAA